MLRRITALALVSVVTASNVLSLGKPVFAQSSTPQATLNKCLGLAEKRKNNADAKNDQDYADDREKGSLSNTLGFYNDLVAGWVGVETKNSSLPSLLIGLWTKKSCARMIAANTK